MAGRPNPAIGLFPDCPKPAADDIPGKPWLNGSLVRQLLLLLLLLFRRRKKISSTTSEKKEVKEEMEEGPVWALAASVRIRVRIFPPTFYFFKYFSN